MDSPRQGVPMSFPRRVPSTRVPLLTTMKNTAIAQAIAARVNSQPLIRSHAGSVKR